MLIIFHIFRSIRYATLDNCLLSYYPKNNQPRGHTKVAKFTQETMTHPEFNGLGKNYFTNGLAKMGNAQVNPLHNQSNSPN